MRLLANASSSDQAYAKIVVMRSRIILVILQHSPQLGVDIKA